MEVINHNTPVGRVASFSNDSFTAQLSRLGCYAEQEILDNHLKPYIEKSKAILDIGGHVGYHSMAYNKINNSCKIKTFEPQREIYNLLNFNIQQNNIDNVEVYNLAVGHKNGNITLSDTVTDGPNANMNFEYGEGFECNFGGLSIGKGKNNVEMVTVDSLNLLSLDYIKIDVEGAESLVLMGAKETITKYKPIICFEYNHKQLSPEYLSDIGFESLPTPHEVLKNYGYQIFENIPYENIIAKFA